VVRVFSAPWWSDQIRARGSEQPHADKEISIGGKKDAGVSVRRSTDPATDGLTDDRIRQGGDDGHGKDADRKTGGPRYLLRPEMDCQNSKFQQCMLQGF